MKKTLFLCALSCMTLFAFAQKSNYYDTYGHKTGSSSTSGDKTTYYDSYGHKTGSSSTSGDKVTYYDRNGHKVGSQSFSK